MSTHATPPATPNRNTHHHSSQELNNWLNSQRQHPNYHTHPGQQHANQQTAFPYQRNYRPTSHQRTITTDTTNDHWGDQPTIGSEDTAHRLRVIARNMNTINKVSQAVSWQALTQAALELEADVLCLQETNTNWTTTTTNMAQQIFNKTTYRASKIAVSASNETTDRHHQPGGTMTAALGRWTA